MIVLAVDSSGPVASAAVARDGKILYEAAASVGLTHSQTLQPMIDQAVRAAGLTPESIDLFACVAGPGSFTGVRIGVCAVKAMAQATGSPCVALNALEVLAAGQYGFEGTICPILDARRGQVYAAAFRLREGLAPQRLMEDDALQLEDYLARLPRGERLLFVGDGTCQYGGRVREVLAERALICPDYRAQLRAGAACYLAPLSPRVTAMELSPIYLRKPQAQREKEARLGGEGIG